MGLVGLALGLMIGPSLGLPIIGWTHIPSALELSVELQQKFAIVLIIMTLIWGYIATWVVNKIG